MRTLRLAPVLGALVLMAGCNGDDAMGPSGPTPSGPTVSIVSGASLLTTGAYSPNPIDVAPGTTVTWVNNDSVAHTSTSTTTLWNSGSMAPNATFSRTFPSAGTFSYFCSLHPNMVGTVNVQ